MSSAGNSLTITQSTIAFNSAPVGGGVSNSHATLTITQSTIVGNSAQNFGGGVYNVPGNGTAKLANTLVVGNAARNDAEASTATDNGGNLIGLPAGYSLGQVLAVDGTGKPLLADNGGPTQTVAVVPDSPAIGPGVAVSGVTTDQRGLPLKTRPVSGAFEPQAPTVSPLALPLAVSTPIAGGTAVKVLSPQTGAERWSVVPFPGYSGAISVAVADVNNDGVSDLIVGAGAGGGPQVKVFDGVSHAEFVSFFAFDPGFLGGVSVAAGDVTGDGVPDFVVAAGPGGGPHVKVFDGATGQVARSFFAYDPGFLGGVNVATGDVNGDGTADVVTGTVRGAPHVRAFDGRNTQVLLSLFAYDPGFQGGVFVAAGDVNGDGKAEIFTGTGPGGGPQVKVFDGRNGAVAQAFFAYDPGFRGGVRVAARDANGDGKADLVVAAGPGGGPHVKAFDVGTLGGLWEAFPFDPTLTGGVSVG